MKVSATATATSVTTGTERRLADFVSLTKPRLNLLVLITTLAGLYLASPSGVDTALLLNTLAGTALVAGGAAALNQVWERRTDALMRRTNTRPVPSGRLGVADGTWFGVLLSATLPIVPWIRRFSLRALLIATTLVAVGLGLIVAVLRWPPG